MRRPIRAGIWAAALAVALWATPVLADEMTGEIVALNPGNESFTIRTDDGEEHVFEAQFGFDIRPLGDLPPPAGSPVDPIDYHELEIGQKVSVIYEEGERYQREAVEVDETPSTPPDNIPAGADAETGELKPEEDVD